jgi:DNA-binding PadR family transcriptional regulator
MARVNGTRQVVLGFLTWRPMSGYDIKKIVEQSVSNFWSESYGQIYPTLRALVREGLASRVPTDVKGERRRNVYAITEKGRAALRRWLEDPVTPGPRRNELLLKLFFVRQVGGEAAKRHIEAFKERMTALSQHYEAIGEQLTRVTLEYGRLEVAAHLAWCEVAIAALERVDPDA